jgi:hypothetical protein
VKAAPEKTRMKMMMAIEETGTVLNNETLSGRSYNQLSDHAGQMILQAF